MTFWAEIENLLKVNGGDGLAGGSDGDGVWGGGQVGGMGVEGEMGGDFCCSSLIT